MSKTVDYYFAPQSPWTYLGHERFAAMAAKAGATVRILPVDLGRVFPVSGGLPLPKRAPQRQAYRLLELKRFSEHLKLPMNIQPKYFPVGGDDAAKLIIAVDIHDGTAQAMRVAGAVFKACWVQERNIASELTFAEILQSLGLSAERIEQAHSQAVQTRYDADTQKAIEIGVFGAPSYVVDGEMFWGQDRLDFVERKLMS
ncbi:2-hydroxychromene-2-carboxylate isomerase [Variovorax sp. PCZ-1]|uniref:2-hydroxychromene-2-carboxylate isomerase n=1 Tax=Variovorax sp. PCZ-1 TaxID=2835533 RepID=UPI001BD1A03C|nr:2-hydroxychromene-2-carboxylate isomerase [Variovorax sp. PCZ-1]